MTKNFVLHSDFLNLEEIARTQTSVFLLMNESQFPWVIQIPIHPGAKEVFDLEAPTYNRVMEESRLLQETLKNLFKADKLNFAALGNVTPQLHFHHIVRFTKDICWPKPVWGNFQARPYTQEDLREMIRLIRENLMLEL